jgi:glutamate synthase (NADPH/NADH) large chain
MHYTNSTVARDILANWDEYLPRFVKVMPQDYRRALEKLQVPSSLSERTGDSPSEG